MNVSLDKHAQGYNFSNTDFLSSLTTGLSGAPLAARHFELADKSSTFIDTAGHKAIAIIESVPVLGGIVAAIEKTIFHTQQLFWMTVGSASLTPSASDGGLNISAASVIQTENAGASSSEHRPIKIEGITTESETLSTTHTDTVEAVASKTHLLAMKKMWRTSQKAIEEHRKEIATYTFPKTEECLPAFEWLTNPKSAPPLHFNHSIAENIGSRPSMEDAHLFKKIDGGALAAVFDGHGGNQVAKYVSTAFEECFTKYMKTTSGDVYKSFISSINEVNEEVAKNDTWDNVGTTAVICYIDEKSHLIYTATLADSEANIYRKEKEDKLISIPLSCVRNWTSPRDAKRASIALEDEKIATQWLKQPAKYLRVGGLNISRAIGDMGCNKLYKGTPISCKPKITVNLLKPKDIVILACDGLKDYVSETTIIKKLTANKDSAEISKELVDYTIHKSSSTDNVTVLTIQID